MYISVYIKVVNHGRENRVTITTNGPDLYGSLYSRQYSSGMVKRVLMGVGDFRLRYKKRFTSAEERQEHTLVANRGRASVAVVPIEWYERASRALGEDDEGRIAFVAYDSAADD